jgi:hypothetical protein
VPGTEKSANPTYLKWDLLGLSQEYFLKEFKITTAFFFMQLIFNCKKVSEAAIFTLKILTENRTEKSFRKLPMACKFWRIFLNSMKDGHRRK